MSDSQYGVRIATSKDGNAYIAGLYGKDGVAQKLKAMGMERNEFQRIIKQGALIVAARAYQLAPRGETEKLGQSIRGYAGKKITPNNAPARYIYGGVVVAQPRSPSGGVSYGKAVSLGRYYKASSFTRRLGSVFTGRTAGVRLQGIRTKGNPYIRTARDQTRESVVKMYNKEIGQWIRKNGFDTEGFSV
jgi:hypothetical protein